MSSIGNAEFISNLERDIKDLLEIISPSSKESFNKENSIEAAQLLSSFTIFERAVQILLDNGTIEIILDRISEEIFFDNFTPLLESKLTLLAQLLVSKFENTCKKIAEANWKILVKMLVQKDLSQKVLIPDLAILVRIF